MVPVFNSVDYLDKKAYKDYFLSEELLMEHAALGIKKVIDKIGNNSKKVFIACGPGNNGADGIVLARLLMCDGRNAVLFIPFGVKSQMAKLQLQRASALGVEIVDEIKECDIVVDALFGSGLKKQLDTKAKDIIDRLNSLSAIKISCDFPSGLFASGAFDKVFLSDITISMGALKLAYFYDKTKDICKKIINVNLGLPFEKYIEKSNFFLLEKSDMRLPDRIKNFVHKGSYGHVGIVEGDMKGAPIISALAALEFGVGLVTIVGENKNIPYSIMSNKYIPKTVNTLALGMGLGDRYSDDKILDMCKNYSLVVDADLFSKKIIKDILKLKQNIVLTPHPKEFSLLLDILENKKITVEEILDNKFDYAYNFSIKYPNIVLILKGVNTLIAFDKKVYIASMATPSLAKGGSGDVLAGMIASLLAQNYNPLEAAISSVLAHSIAASNMTDNNYSLTPEKLIKEIGRL